MDVSRAVLALATPRRGLLPAPDPRDAVVVETNLWAAFTNQEDYPKPWKTDYAMCRHCMTGVRYDKKSEVVIAHLRGCEPFKDYCIV
jgi:hypothetical protein